MSNKKSFFSVSAIAFGLVFATGCGQKVGGTYILSQQGAQTQALNCSQITLNLTTQSNNLVTASGSNGTCTETLNGTDVGNGTIQVTSLTMSSITNYSTSAMNSCVYTGTLTVSGNVVNGVLYSSSVGGSGYGYSYCGNVTITGTKN